MTLRRIENRDRVNLLEISAYRSVSAIPVSFPNVCPGHLASQLTLLVPPPPSSMATPSSSSPASWQQLWEAAQPRLQSIQSSLSANTLPPAGIFRVGQLDAELLDQELVQLLQEPLSKALGLINVSITT